MIRAAMISFTLFFLIVFTSYAWVIKHTNGLNGEEPQKLIIADEINPEINLREIEDPNKPKVEEILPDDNTSDQTTPSVPVKVKPQKIPRSGKISRNFDVPRSGDSLDFTKLLDSLQNTSVKDTAGKNISGNVVIPDSLIYKIPDSLKASIDTASIAIRIRSFPKEWKFQRVDDKSFYFYFGGDTVNSRGDSVTIFIYLNSKAPEDDIKNFTQDFKLTDSLNTTLIAKTLEPKNDPGTEKMIYHYIISGKADRLNIKASVNKKYLENNKTLPQTIEAIVRSISFRNPN